MRPAWSVILFTTAIGVGQGLLVVMVVAEVLGRIGVWPEQLGSDYVVAGICALSFMGFGLIASFFHLGKPERAWRSVSRWRTSWLSREVIVLPVTMCVSLLFTLLHALAGNGVSSTTGTLVAGVAVVVLALALYLCTAMIYVCVRFIPQWSTPLTVLNFFLLGLASGATLATALGYLIGSIATEQLAGLAFFATIAAMIARILHLYANQRTVEKVTLRSAIGVHSRRIKQVAKGFEGGSFNTREFRHGVAPLVFEAARYLLVVLAFLLPLTLIVLADKFLISVFFVYAAAIQLLGVVVERWFFFADATHVQNLYYQAVDG